MKTPASLFRLSLAGLLALGLDRPAFGLRWLHAAPSPRAADLQEPETPEAPDGRRGIGSSTELDDILRLFRQPSEEDERFLEELGELETQLSILAANVNGLYRSRGYYEVVERGEEESLDALHRAFTVFLEDPERALTGRGDEAQTWAVVFLDPRFRVRMALLEGWQEDARQVRVGLMVLAAMTNGWTNLSEDEARNIAGRIDLSASLLRARLRDLEILREAPGSEAEIDPERLARVLALGEVPAGQRTRVLEEERALAAFVADDMWSLLFSARLREQAAHWLRWRSSLDKTALAIRADVRVWQPHTPEGKKAPEAIRRTKKTTRRREAFRRALEGLAADPLDEELAYAAAIMARFVSGTYDSASFFDRFLALRGIRLHLGETWVKRDLDEREEDAIYTIQQFENEGLPGNGSGGPPAGPPGDPGGE